MGLRSGSKVRAVVTRLAGYIITLNEAERIEHSLRSLQRVCEAVLVVDSGSTDATVEIAQSLGCEVLSHPFAGFSSQRNVAIDELVRRHSPDYVISIDADEWLDDELEADITERILTAEPCYDVYLLHLRSYFDGRLLHWGGYSRTQLPRIFRPNLARYESREVNEHLAVPRGARIGKLKGFLVNADVISWSRYIAKHNDYSTLEADARVKLLRGAVGATTLGGAIRYSYLRRRWLREHIWNRLPGRPAVRFLQIYVLCGGFLDGNAGFRRAVFDAWFEMCIDLKTQELLHAGDAPRA
jgi:glycosyltransferase involved in cell wall biosynthesis